MSKVLRYTVTAVLANILLAFLWLIPSNYAKNEDGLGWIIIGFIISGMALFIQLILGIIFAVGQNKKDLGKGLLLATGICLLIGLSVCGVMLF
jgi:hypothetical protein